MKIGDLVNVDVGEDSHRYHTGGLGLLVKMVLKSEQDPSQVWMAAFADGDLADVLIGDRIERHELLQISVLKPGDLVEVNLAPFHEPVPGIHEGGIGFVMKAVLKAEADPQKVWMPAFKNGDLVDVLIGVRIERHEVRCVKMLNALNRTT